MMDQVIRSAMFGKVLGVLTAILLVSGSLVAAGDDDLPPGYAGKTLPPGLQMDSTMLAAGKAIYEGKLKPDVNCVMGLMANPLVSGTVRRIFPTRPRPGTTRMSIGSFASQRKHPVPRCRATRTS